MHCSRSISKRWPSVRNNRLIPHQIAQSPTWSVSDLGEKIPKNKSLAGAVLFSKLDARHGYWSVQLDDESKRLTTFNSPFGRFEFIYHLLTVLNSGIVQVSTNDI